MTGYGAESDRDLRDMMLAGIEQMYGVVKILQPHVQRFVKEYNSQGPMVDENGMQYIDRVTPGRVVLLFYQLMRNLKFQILDQSTFLNDY